MTFLEFVCTRLMGPAIHGSMWHCPFHEDNHPSFSVRPAKQGYPVKFKCFGCGTWGDEYDLMRLYYPGDKYPQHRVCLDKWRRDYEREVPSEMRESITTPGTWDRERNPVEVWHSLTKQFCNSKQNYELMQKILKSIFVEKEFIRNGDLTNDDDLFLIGEGESFLIDFQCRLSKEFDLGLN